MHIRKLKRQALSFSTMIVGATRLALTAMAMATTMTLVPGVARAQDATWLLNPGTGNFNTAANWNPASVPTGTAFFGATNQSTILLLANTTIGGWTFNAAADDYTFSNGEVLNFNGAGISIIGGSAAITNNFVLNFLNSSTAGSATITNVDSLNFSDTSTAGSATIVNNGFVDFLSGSAAGSATITNANTLSFNNNSTADSADITNEGDLNFNNNSTAGSATITNDIDGGLRFNNTSTAGSAIITNNGTIDFNSTSTAGSATITNDSNSAFLPNLRFRNSSTAGNATITNILGSLVFFDTSTAGSAIITNNDTMSFDNSSTAGAAAITNNANLRFFDTSTAGGATITSNSALSFTSTSTAGSATIINTNLMRFFDTSTAGVAAITNNLGGNMEFLGTSTAGIAAITNNLGGNMEFRDTSTAGSATITNTSVLNFSQTSTAGIAAITNDDLMRFLATSTAGSATITNNSALDFLATSTAGSAAVTNDDTVTFLDNSTGGQAQFINNVGGVVDFSQSTGPTGTGQLTAGSLAGAGDYLLGDNELTVGSNNLSSTASGVISGAGAATGTSLIKTGTGTFTLSGASTYTGATVVDEGALIVNGAIVSPTTVNGGGTLGGTGTLGPVTVNSGGVYAPGNSIGTMTINGAFTLNAGAIFEVEVNAAGQGDKVIVNGTVNLTGSVLSVLAANGNYKPQTEYVIIANDGNDAVAGTFASVATNLAFLDPTVLYAGGDGNDVVLVLERNDVSFDDVADTPNEEGAARGLGDCTLDETLCLALLNLSPEQARQAFNALSGEIHATLAGMLADDSRYVREAILGRLMQASYANNAGQLASLAAAGPQVASLDASAMALGYGDKSLGYQPAPLAFWTRAYGAWGDFDGNRNAATADRDLGGFVSGMDAQLSGSWRAGLATGASFSNIDVNDRYSSADVESFLLAGYLGGMAGPLALRGGGAWAWNDIDTSRAVVFPGFFERQNASYDADTGQVFGEIAYPTQMMGVALEPFGGLAYVAVDTDTFREHGGALAGLRGTADQDVGYSTLGLRAATTTQTFGMTVTPHVSAAWQHAFDDVTPNSSLAFASAGIDFGIEGVPLAQDSVLIDAGLDFALGTNTTVGVSYSGQFGDGVTDNGVKGRLTWLF